MKATVLFALAVLAAGGGEGAAMSGDGWYFFSDADRQRMRAAAETEWGRPIVAAMREAVEARRAHSMVVPATEAGHFHFYFCPDHKRILWFDWDSPHAHYCPDGDHFLQGERYDNAWLQQVHGRNQRFLLHCALLHLISGERTYLEHIRSLLLDYAARYPHYRLHGHDMKPSTYGGRMLCQTLDESVWATDVAPAFVEALPVFSPEEADTVRESLLRRMAECIFAHRAGGNWQVWHNSGLAHIAIALRDEDWLRIALDDPRHGYHAMLNTGVTAEGWWDERSPGYHFYPLRAMVRTAEAVRCRGIELYDDRLRAMFVGPLRCVYSDLSFPAHNDGWHGLSLVSQASLYEIAALRFGDSALSDLLAKCYARDARDHWKALLHGKPLTPDPSPLHLESCVLADTGVAFLRSASRTVVLKYGPYGGGHGHPDKLSISIHDGTRELVPDLGTTGYGVPDHAAWYRKTLAHSTVVVDEADQRPAAGERVSFAGRADGGSVEAACTEAYDGVVMRRSLELERAALVDRFSCKSDTEHVYDYVLILADPVEPPALAVAASLPESGGYQRIEDARQWDVEQSETLEVGGARVTLTAAAPFVLIAGRAPGIPGSYRLESSFQSCYPLIVRTRGKTMRVEARWELAP